MTRALRHVYAEAGTCQHCGKPAGEHAVDGTCSPLGTRPSDLPRPRYRGNQQVVFVNVGDPELRVALRAAVAVEAILPAVQQVEVD